MAVFVAVKDSSHIETDKIFVADKLTIEKLLRIIMESVCAYLGKKGWTI